MHTSGYFLAVLLLAATNANAASITYNCEFSSWSNEEGNFAAEDRFEMLFAFDDVTKMAVIVGNQGIQQVMPVVGTDGITFLETLVTGSVQSTTITLSGDAVHSRNTMILGDLVPTQYYGHCDIETSEYSP